MRDLNKQVYPSPESSSKGIIANPVSLEAVHLPRCLVFSLSPEAKDQHPKALLHMA
jgi:hypothetical protein